jgi:hypothetical protein
LKRGFFKILVTVVARGYPVTGNQHFSGYLSIAAFVGWDEVAVIEGAKPKQAVNNDQQQNLSWVQG